MVDEKTARNRVFFVSAKEVLQLRTQSQQIPEERGMPDGWKARLMEFERSGEIRIINQSLHVCLLSGCAYM